jgi:hypothetical protein
LTVFAGAAAAAAAAPGRLLRPDGTPVDPAYFPLAVWLQAPANAARYRAAGINLYVGLWQGPTDAQLDALAAAGMPVVCRQNAAGLARRDDPLLAAWMHDDEPDNAQPRRDGGEGWGPPVPPNEIAADYRRMKSADPSRPVFLNLGQGVAWDDWYGRGERTRRPEDYPTYARGADIVSFDIYPAVHDHDDVRGRLWLVPFGVSRLRRWAPGKPVWNCVEASRISNRKVKPSPEQVRYEVWSAIAAGSRGIVYFVHQFEPKFVEASLLEDPELLAAVTALNREVSALAPLLNAETVDGEITVETDPPGAPLVVLHKRRGTEALVLACTVRRSDRPIRFRLSRPAELLAEERLDGFDVRRYRLR